MKVAAEIAGKDAGQIMRHISYSDDYQRLLTRLTYVKRCDSPERAIKQWNDSVFGRVAEMLWNKRIGLY